MTTETRAGHGAFSGTHSHSHSAFGSQGEDDEHSHEHTHDGDADHDHAHGRAEGSAGLHFRAKYTEADRNRMAASGEAMPDGSYPIGDEEDLRKAIKAVGRGNADHDTIRKHVIARAKALKLADLIPDNWNSDGSLKDAKAVWSSVETRETHNDLSKGLDAAVEAANPGAYTWLQDFDADHVIFSKGGQLHKAPYTVEPEGPITLGPATKVRPITDYVPAERSSRTPASAARAAAYADPPPLSDVARLSLLAQRATLAGSREIRSRPFTGCEMRERPNGSGGTDLVFTGYASVFDTPYTITDWLGDFAETVTRSAFDKTIAEGCDTVFLRNHADMTLARTKSGTLRLATDSTGLHTEARLDPANYAVQALRSAVERGDVDEMSFAFRCIRDAWNKNYDERQLVEVSLHHGDVSAVNFGANGATAGTLAMRSRQFQFVGFDSVVAALREFRSGASLSATSTATLKHVLSLCSTADTAMDNAQVVLSDLLGVTNPDIAQDAAMQQNAATRAEQRALGDVCNCCTDCEGSLCDGTCCDNCGVGTDSSYDVAATTGANSASDFDFEATLAILKRKGGRP